MSSLPNSPRFLPFLLFLAMTAHGGIALTGGAGTTTRGGFGETQFAYSFALYGKFDDQTLLGIQSGQGVAGNSSWVPILGSAVIRLPLGRVVLPVLTGDLGYALADSLSGFLWKAGGGLDCKNGRRSSILLLGGFEKLQGDIPRSAWYGRLALLLEY